MASVVIYVGLRVKATISFSLLGEMLTLKLILARN